MKRLKVRLILVVSILLVILGIGGYLYLQRQITILKKKVESLAQVNDSLEKKLSNLRGINNFLPKASNNSGEINKSPHQLTSRGGRKRFWVIATAYSSQDPGVDKITATGTRVKEGRTLAVDPKVIPYGSRVFIPGYGWRIAEDTGKAIRGRRIDLYFPNRKAALKFGRRKLEVLVLLP